MEWSVFLVLRFSIHIIKRVKIMFYFFQKFKMNVFLVFRFNNIFFFLSFPGTCGNYSSSGFNKNNYNKQLHGEN